ncbi:MAG: TfpX/TfpZ family type IV pilin accessory protein [Gallionella sp.]
MVSRPNISRRKAFLIHLTISAAIAASVITLMMLLWYQPPFFSALGGKHLLLILLGVDVTLGPLITLIIFNPQKSRKALTFDLSAIAIMQTAALLFGISVMFEARPVFVVFSKGSFDLVTANMLSKQDIAQAKYPAYRSLPLTGPVYAYSEMPADIKDRNELVFSAMTGGKDLPQYPQYYKPYSDYGQTEGRAAMPLTELIKLNPAVTAEIDRSVQSSGRAASDIGYVPLRAKYQDQAVLLGKSDGKVLALLDVNPWPVSAMAKHDAK